MALLEASYDNRNWFDLPTPLSENYEPTYTHLENSYRDANGNLHRDIQRRDLAKVTTGWGTLNASQMSLLQSLYDKDFFYLKFTDNYGNRVVKKVYAGPLTGKVKYVNRFTYELVQRTSVAMNFIEY